MMLSTAATSVDMVFVHVSNRVSYVLIESSNSILQRNSLPYSSTISSDTALRALNMDSVVLTVSSKPGDVLRSNDSPFETVSTLFVTSRRCLNASSRAKSNRDVDEARNCLSIACNARNCCRKACSSSANLIANAADLVLNLCKHHVSHLPLGLDVPLRPSGAVLRFSGASSVGKVIVRY